MPIIESIQRELIVQLSLEKEVATKAQREYHRGFSEGLAFALSIIETEKPKPLDKLTNKD